MTLSQNWLTEQQVDSLATSQNVTTPKRLRSYASKGKFSYQSEYQVKRDSAKSWSTLLKLPVRTSLHQTGPTKPGVSFSYQSERHCTKPHLTFGSWSRCLVTSQNVTRTKTHPLSRLPYQQFSYQRVTAPTGKRLSSFNGLVTSRTSLHQNDGLRKNPVTVVTSQERHCN